MRSARCHRCLRCSWQALRGLLAGCLAAAVLAAQEKPMGQEAAVPPPERQVVVPNTAEHPRNGEGDIVALRNGSLLLGYGRWDKEGSDFGRAEIWSRTSHDGGRTWGEDRVLVPNEGKVTTFEVGFLRLQSGDILLCYCVKDSTEDCAVCFRRSADEGRTWGERISYRAPAPYTGYTAINNNRLIQLRTGRILLAVYDGYVRGTPIISFTLFSDDDGRTWRKSSDVDIRTIAPDNRYGADEPAVVELKDGRVLMIVRTDLGFIARAYSADHGTTWGKPEPIKGLTSPNSPASIARIPQTGDLLLVWNQSRAARSPLTSAISRDEGETWVNRRYVQRGAGSFCYTSITPVGDRLLLTYYGPGGLVLTSARQSWFRAEETVASPWLSEGPVQELKPDRQWHLQKGACVYVQDLPDHWDGSRDSVVEATVVLRSLQPGRRATAMLWVGDAEQGKSCALYLRAGPAADAISFSESMQPVYTLPDSGQTHIYRVVTHHQARTAEAFIDDARTPALSTPLGPVLGLYDLNRILYGDPNVDFLGGESDLLTIRWTNGN